MTLESAIRTSILYFRARGADFRRFIGHPKVYPFIVGGLGIATILYVALIRVPLTFPVGVMVTIPEGSTAKEASKIFRDARVVRSAWVLEKLIILKSAENKVAFGDYRFARPISVLEIADRSTTGRFELLSIRVTIPEGFTRYDIAEVFEKEEFERFDKEEFLRLTTEKEGFLFPDTYTFYSNANAAKVISVLEANFWEKIALLQSDIERFGRNLEDVVIMASLLEREARTTESRQIIAGILWQRIKIGMPLQVDAAFNYVNGKNTFQLTKADLKTDSPYNTYKYKGLPQGAIANPGLAALKAAVTPITTRYLYYLSDYNGKLYYARDFTAHKRNKAKYLP